MRRHCAWHSSGAGCTAQPLCFQPALLAPAEGRQGWVGRSRSPLSASPPNPSTQTHAEVMLALRLHLGSPAPRCSIHQPRRTALRLSSPPGMGCGALRAQGTDPWAPSASLPLAFLPCRLPASQQRRLSQIIPGAHQGHGAGRHRSVRPDYRAVTGRGD